MQRWNSLEREPTHVDYQTKKTGITVKMVDLMAVVKFSLVIIRAFRWAVWQCKWLLHLGRRSRSEHPRAMRRSAFTTSREEEWPTPASGYGSFSLRTALWILMSTRSEHHGSAHRMILMKKGRASNARSHANGRKTSSVKRVSLKSTSSSHVRKERRRRLLRLSISSFTF